MYLSIIFMYVKKNIYLVYVKKKMCDKIVKSSYFEQFKNVGFCY